MVKYQGGGKLDIGFGEIGIFDKRYNRVILDINGELQLNGHSYFGPGAKINIAKNGRLNLGNNVANSAACQIVCTKSISIGEQCIISWDTLIMDCDYHHILNLTTGNLNINQKPISIGQNVWLSAKSTVLKGTVIGDNSVVAANTVVSADFSTENVIIAGMPARIVKTNIKPVH